MTKYYKPWYYGVSHVLTGFAAVWYPIIGILGLIYQLGQLILNIRVFPVEWIIKRGNSIQHTLLKISEMAVGYGIGIMTSNALNTI